ncbi:MAG: hypothetical protein ACE5FF_01935 [Saprospiraceae bacterium]
MEEQKNSEKKRKGFSRAEIMLAVVVLLGILYFLQKSGCNLLKSEEKIEWLDK